MKKGDPLVFDAVNAKALHIANLIHAKKAALLSVLTRYETYQTAEDEVERSLDLLTNLTENKSYFRSVVGPVAVFMPSNQPLYSLTCFAIIPALMSEQVCVKPPETMSSFYAEMLEVIEITPQMLPIEHMKLPRSECVDIFTAIKPDPETGLEIPVFEAVIFTGTSKNADILRKKFHKSVLFITNGSGHNPVVITETADIDKAVDAIMSVRTYNQGQDCASPNAILVHSDVYDRVMRELRRSVANLVIGPYNSPETDIGPISRPDTLVLVQDFLTKNYQYIDKSTEGVIRIRSSVIEPTIVAKPLRDGANFEEVFAPVFIIQRYDNDKDLGLYFEDERYANNAMYITVFGKSGFVEYFVISDKVGTKLHDSSTVLYDTDLHKPGVERGVLPYGGYGRGASCVSKDGKIVSKPTLPQREIFDYLVQGKAIEGSTLNSNTKSQVQSLTHTYFGKEDPEIDLQELSKLYTPEILKWFATRSLTQLFKLSTDKESFKYYDEFDAICAAFRDDSISNADRALFTLIGLDSTETEPTVSFRQLLGLGQSVHWDTDKLKLLAEYQGLQFSVSSINARLPRIKYWLEKYNPDMAISFRSERNDEYVEKMSQNELLQVRELHSFLSDNLSKEISLENLEFKLYELPKSKNASKSETSVAQRRFFKNLYNLLIGTDTGPRLATFIWAADQRNILRLLDLEGIL